MPCLVPSDIFTVVSLLLGPRESGNGGDGMDAHVPDHIRPYVKHELDQVSLWLEHATFGRCSATLQRSAACAECASHKAPSPRLRSLAVSCASHLTTSEFERQRRRGRGPHAHERGEAFLAACFGIQKLFGVLI